MNKTLKILLIIIILIGGLIGFLGYLGNQTFSDMGECGMSAGPIYGDTIDVDTKLIDIEQFIDIPNGKFGLMNLMDSLTPKLIKFDSKGNILWAVEFGKDTLIGIPHQNLSEMELIKDKYGLRLTFFNHSYSEPGRIYLTEDYEIEFMCLNPF